MIEYADVIVDLQYGDTGKGKITNQCLATDNGYNLVVRYNGGSNAGHTIYRDEVKIVTHQVPIGVLYGVISVIGPGCVVNIPKLKEELEYLRGLGVWAPETFLLIDKRAHIVQDRHLTEDSTDTVIGTTRQGIGPAYRDKYGRTGMTFEMWYDAQTGDRDPFVDNAMTDIYALLHGSNRVQETAWRILCEGAQGFYLDPMWGDYPFVTSSHCTVAAAIQNGIPHNKIRHVFGVAKGYETYVGNKPNFIPNNQLIHKPVFETIQTLGKEYGATTGRLRQVRFLNLDELIPAININGVTRLVLNKMDILDNVGHADFNPYRFQYNNNLITTGNAWEFRTTIQNIIQENCPTLVGNVFDSPIKFSYGAE